MKTAIRLLIAAWMLMLGIRAEAQQTVTSNVTVVLTITNQASNGFSFQINGGPQREWTNFVSSATTQIQETNDVRWTATNLFLALSASPNQSPYVKCVMTNSNVLVLTTIQGQNLTIITNNIGSSGWSNWVSWVTYNNPLTNGTGFRVPTNAAGVIEQSNNAYGLFTYLNSPFMTNPSVASYAVNPALAQWSNFLTAAALAGLSNQVGVLSTNGSNYSFSLWQNGSNFTWIEATNATNFTTNFATNVYLNNSNYTFNASNYLWTLFDPLLGAINPWQTGLNVNLTNEFGKTRYYAQDNGGSIGGYSYFYESDGSTLWLNNDGNGDTYMRDRAGANRVEMDGPNLGIGNVYVRGITAQNLANNGPNIGGGANPTIGAGIAVGGNNGTLIASRPVVFQNVTLPSVSIGSCTNFPPLTLGSISGTTTNKWTVPGDCMTNVGDGLVRKIYFQFSGAGTYSFAVEVQSGNNIFQTGSFTSLSSGSLYVECDLVNAGGGTWTYGCHGEGVGLTTNNFVQVGQITIATGGGNPTNFFIDAISQAGSSDTTIYMDRNMLCPSPVWQVLP